MVGQCSTLKRKSIEPMALHVEGGNIRGMQRCMSDDVWDEDHMRQTYHGLVADEMGAPDGVLMFDESGFVKKGKDSVGVARQYCGTLGKVENSQVGPNLAKGDFFWPSKSAWGSKPWKSAVVLAGRRYPVRRVARKCAQTTYCEVSPAPEGQTRAKSDVIRPKYVVKRGKRTFGSCYSTGSIAAQRLLGQNLGLRQIRAQ